LQGVFGEALPPGQSYRLLRIQMARETGWPLHYIDGLPLAEVLDYLAVLGGLADVRAFYGPA
jgi:hypothetical protein